MKSATFVAILVSCGLLDTAFSQCVEGSPDCLAAPTFSPTQTYTAGQYVKYNGICYQAKWWINPGSYIPTLFDADNAWLPCTSIGTSCAKAQAWDASLTYTAGTYVLSSFGCCFKNSYWSKGNDPLLFDGTWVMVNPDDPNCAHSHTCGNAPTWFYGGNWQPNEHICWDAKCWRMISTIFTCERPDWRPEMWQYVEDSNLCPRDDSACLSQYDWKRPDQWDPTAHYQLASSVWYGGCCFNKISGSATDPVPDVPTGSHWIKYDPACDLKYISAQSAADWNPQISYRQGSFVRYNGCIYTNQWYSTNDNPEAQNMWGPWDKIDPVCNEDLNCSDQYQGAHVYQVGDLVCWHNQCWRATQRSCDRVPDISPNDWRVDDNFTC